MSICNDVANIIVSYLPEYELLDWIDENKLFLPLLSSSDKAIDLLIKHKHKIDWDDFALNSSSKAIPFMKENIDRLDRETWEYISLYAKDISILEENLDKISWSLLCKNPAAIPLIEKEIKENNGKRINWSTLSSLPEAMYILKDNMEKIDWKFLALNPAAISLLEKEVKTYENHDWWWRSLCRNPAAASILKKYPHKIDWGNVYVSIGKISDSPELMALARMYPDTLNWDPVSRRPEFISIIEDNFRNGGDNIDWPELCENPAAIHIIERELENADGGVRGRVNWYFLSGNPAAGHILKIHPNKINWDRLCENTSPEAIELLKDNIENHDGDKINWASLSSNPAAISLLKDNMDKIDWYEFSENPAIFTHNNLFRIHRELISVGRYN